MAGYGLAGLLGGAGAAGGLETLLARRLLERQQGERERATVADEQFQRQQLGEQGELRRATLKQAEELKQAQLAQAIQIAQMQEQGRAQRAQEALSSRELIAGQGRDTQKAIADQGNQTRLTLGQLMAGSRATDDARADRNLKRQEDSDRQRREADDRRSLLQRQESDEQTQWQIFQQMLKDAGDDPEAQQKARDHYQAQLAHIAKMRNQIQGGGAAPAQPEKRWIFQNGQLVPAP